MASRERSESFYVELAEAGGTRNTVLASALCNFSSQRVGTDGSKLEVEFFSIHGACWWKSSLFGRGRPVEQDREAWSRRLCLLSTSPPQGPIPNTGVGGRGSH